MAKPNPQPEPRRPKPLIVPPRKEHTHTIILLHDKGDKGREFGRGFLKSTRLQDHFPGVRFVFPCAFNAPAPATPPTAGDKTQPGARKRVHPPPQWFDDPPHVRPSASATASLPETARFLQRLVHEEAKVIAQTGRCGMHEAHGRIFSGGKGQGGAAALLYILGSHRRLGGVVCFDAVLPWEYQMEVALEVTGARGGDVGAWRGVNFVRGLLGFERLDERSDLVESRGGLRHLRTSVFLGCGGKLRPSARPIASLLDCGFRMDLNERWCENGEEERYAHADNVEAVLGFLAGTGVPRVDNVTECKLVGEREVSEGIDNKI